MVVELSRKSEHNAAKLKLNFERKVHAEAKGLFRSFFGPSKTTLVTHFKPNHARRLFPCFDEPEFKQTFK